MFKAVFLSPECGYLNALKLKKIKTEFERIKRLLPYISYELRTKKLFVNIATIRNVDKYA